MRAFSEVLRLSIRPLLLVVHAEDVTKLMCHAADVDGIFAPAEIYEG